MVILCPRYLKPSGSCPLRGSLTHFRDYLSESMIIDKPRCEKKAMGHYHKRFCVKALGDPGSAHHVPTEITSPV